VRVRRFPLVTGAIVSLGLLAGAVPSAAETDARPISVPLLGTQGIAGRYPASMSVSPPGGAAQRGSVRVALHKVTHPCPEHLAILLVHSSAKYLLMSHAGGCRALQGTDVVFSDLVPPLPDTEPSNPPHVLGVALSPSNYGTVPDFPAPAPAGPYTLGMPPGNGLIGGIWQLYVMDTDEGERGVIAGGWSLEYDPFIEKNSQTSVDVPSAGTGPGIAAQYPMTFDYASARPEAVVRSLSCSLNFGHTFPDDLRIVLQSPAGTTVALMINAGGAFDVPIGTTVNFTDTAAAPLPDNAQITAGNYKPGGIYGLTSDLGAPAPAGPYGTSFAAFDGEPVAGTWRLWVYDDKLLDVGTVSIATLSIGTLEPPAITALTPTTGTIARQPFVRVSGQIIAPTSNVTSAYSATWRVRQGSAFYDAGAFTLNPETGEFSADVPVKKGANNILAVLTDPFGRSTSAGTVVNVNEFTYSLAEGATGGFFDTDVVAANSTDGPAPVMIDFLPESGPLVSRDSSVPAGTPLLLHVDDYVPADAVSTVVHSTDAVPLAVERTMSWDARGYGGHGGSATAPATEWLFAEGSQGYFDTYVLLANSTATDANATLRFLLEGGGVVQQVVVVPAQSRRTVYAGGIPALVNQSFGIDVVSTQPIIAERAMYFPHDGPRLFEGGHESAGVTETATSWFLAEGATGPFFESFVLLMNPTTTKASVELTYLLPGGETVIRVFALPANSRQTIDVETVDPKLTNTPVSIRVVSDIGIVAERAMYWPDVSQGWQEAHNSFGVTQLGLRWGLADGRLGGARGYETYVLLANPNSLPAEVRVRFTKPGVSVVRTYTVDPTSRLTIWTSHDVPELGEGSFNVDVASVNYVPIAVEKAMYWNADGVVWAAGTDVTASRLPPP
jgi:hypothetical protein